MATVSMTRDYDGPVLAYLCPDCNGMVVDRALHDAWHEQVASEEHVGRHARTASHLDEPDPRW